MAKSPTYYTRGSIECWDFIRDQQLNYHLGCAIKYICRAGHKDNKHLDLVKAIHYLENELHNTPNIDGSSGGVPFSLQFFNEWASEDDAEIFDR